jgi:hypothetical protein
MYTPLDTVYILFETFFVYVKMRELFDVAELGGTLYMLKSTCNGVTHYAILASLLSLYTHLL